MSALRRPLFRDAEGREQVHIAQKTNQLYVREKERERETWSFAWLISMLPLFPLFSHIYKYNMHIWIEVYAMFSKSGSELRERERKREREKEIEE